MGANFDATCTDNHHMHHPDLDSSKTAETVTSRSEIVSGGKARRSNTRTHLAGLKVPKREPVCLMWNALIFSPVMPFSTTADTSSEAGIVQARIERSMAHIPPVLLDVVDGRRTMSPGSRTGGGHVIVSCQQKKLS